MSTTGVTTSNDSSSAATNQRISNYISTYISRYCKLFQRSMSASNSSINIHDIISAITVDVSENASIYSNVFSNISTIPVLPCAPMTFPLGRLLQFNITPHFQHFAKIYGTGMSSGCGFHSVLNMLAGMNLVRESITGLPDLQTLLSTISSGNMLSYNEYPLVQYLNQTFQEIFHGELCTINNDVMDTVGVLADLIAPHVNPELIQFHLRTRDIMYKELDHDNNKIILHQVNVNNNYSDLFTYINRNVQNDIVDTEPVSIAPAITTRFAQDFYNITVSHDPNVITRCKKELIVWNIYYRKPVYVIFDLATMMSYFNANAGMMPTFNILDVKYKLVSVIEHRGLHYVNIFLNNGTGYVYDDMSLDVTKIDPKSINWTEVSVYCYVRDDSNREECDYELWENDILPETFASLKQKMSEAVISNPDVMEEIIEDIDEEESEYSSDSDVEEEDVEMMELDEEDMVPLDNAEEDDSDEDVPEEDEENVQYVPYDANVAENAEEIDEYMSDGSDGEIEEEDVEEQ